MAARRWLAGEVGRTPAASDAGVEQPLEGCGQGAGIYAWAVVRGAQADACRVFPAGSDGGGDAGYSQGRQSVEFVAILCGFYLSGKQSAVLPAALAMGP